MDPSSGVNLNNCTDIIQKIVNPCPPWYGSPEPPTSELIVPTIICVVAVIVGIVHTIVLTKLKRSSKEPA